MSAVEPREHGRESALLRADQRTEVKASTLSQHELHQQLGADIAHMIHGSREPAVDEANAGWRRGDQLSRRCAALLDATGHGELGRLEPVDRAIDEGTAQRPDGPHLAIAGEQLHDPPSVGRLFSQQGEGHPLAERKVGERSRGHGASVADRLGDGGRRGEATV